MVGNLLLVASADAQTRDLATKLFARAGFTTQQTASGEAALAAIDQSNPGLILIDLRLEGMSGYELCYEVKQRFGADTSIILLSESHGAARPCRRPPIGGGRLPRQAVRSRRALGPGSSRSFPLDP
jgi:two-component system, sensor histidine kinase ChiS